MIFPQKGSFQPKNMSEKFGCGSGFGDLNETAKADSAVSMRPRNPL
jgi:hypothetical protein